MTIEQVFRDHKNRRGGWALRNIQIKHADRFDRLLLILAFAYVLLMGLGHYCHARFHSGHWSSNTRSTDCSAFTIGRVMLRRLQVSPIQALAALKLVLQQANQSGDDSDAFALAFSVRLLQ